MNAKKISPALKTSVSSLLPLRVALKILNLIFARYGMNIRVDDKTKLLLSHELFTLHMRQTFFYKWLKEIFQGNAELCFGEGYMGNDWWLVTGKLEDVLWIFYQLLEDKTIFKRSNKSFLSGQTNTPKISRVNIAHHYDLGNDLYKNFLDTEMNYSAAIYAKNMSLAQAQTNKNEILIKLLRPQKPNPSVLEIGCGWGALSRAMCRKGFHVTGISLATAQINWCRKIQDEEKLHDVPLRYRLVDYREHCKQNIMRYDHVISVEMIDHVGKEHMGEFFQHVYKALKSSGTFVLQILTRPRPGRTTKWIDKYIFPGGYIASLAEIRSALDKTDFDYKIINYGGQHYAKTLHEWQNKFNDNWSELSKHGYDKTFYRMWNYYLSASTMAFAKAGFETLHLQLKK